MSQDVTSAGVRVSQGLIHYGTRSFPVTNVASVNVIGATGCAMFIGMCCWLVLVMEVFLSALGLFSLTVGLAVGGVLGFLGYKLITIPAKLYELTITLASGERISLGQHSEMNANALKRAIEASSSRQA